jgi:large repetitive protein
LLTQPISITGSNEVCSGISSLYTTTSVAGATHYLWEYTGMGILASDSLSVDFVPATTGTLSVSAINLCDTSLAQTMSITVNDIPNQPDTIFGLLEYCVGLTENYSVDPISNALSYTWTYNGSTLSETTENLALTPTTGDTLFVTANNTCGISTSAIAIINLLEIPSQPVSILGSPQVCNGNSEIYSVTQTPGVDSYIWEYSPVGVLSEISDSLDLTPTSDGILSVIASNSCGNSVAQTVNITIIDVPAQPTIINGATTVCSGISSTYSIDPVLGAVDYTWEFSPVGVLSETTENLNLTPTADGILSVLANNSCGSSIPQSISLTINEAPNQPNAIVGNTNLCDTLLETYSIDPVTNADTYSWSFSGSGDATSLTTSTSFAPTSNGTLSVVASNTCGTSTSSDLVISVTVIENTITDNVPFLEANQSGATYQWLDCSLSNLEIIGATNQIYEVLGNGSFAVEITLNSCIDTSECILVNLDNILENNPFNNVVLYPNPSNENVTISNLSYGTQVEIVDVMGKLVFSTTVNNTALIVSTNELANGTYFVKLSKDSDTKTLPLLVIH